MEPGTTRSYLTFALNFFTSVLQKAKTLLNILTLTSQTTLTLKGMLRKQQTFPAGGYRQPDATPVAIWSRRGGVQCHSCGAAKRHDGVHRAQEEEKEEHQHGTRPGGGTGRARTHASRTRLL